MKVSKLRALRARAAVFMNGLAPPGWCEIQRVDSPDVEGVEPYASDDIAGAEVALFGGLPGSVLFYAPGSGVSFVITSGEVAEKEWAVLDTAHLELAAGEAPHWIVIVPVTAARRVGLITGRDARSAIRGWT